MIRLAAIHNSRLSAPARLAAVTFAAGLTIGAAIAIAMAGRPVAIPAPAPSQQADIAIAPGPAGGLPAEVLRVIDGDTFEARVGVWPGLAITTKVRLRGIDTPEINGRCPRERAGALAAREALSGMLASGGVAIGQIGPDKYGGRVVASAASRTTPDVSAALLARGVARPYGGGQRQPWC